MPLFGTAPRIAGVWYTAGGALASWLESAAEIARLERELRLLRRRLDAVELFAYSRFTNYERNH
jgi:hypothetical protein